MTAFILAAGVLTGCSTPAAKERRALFQQYFDCPEAGMVQGAAQKKWGDGARIALDGARISCRMHEDGKVVDLEVNFALTGVVPAIAAPTVPFEYFVAVLDAQDVILSRESFQVALDTKDKKHTEEIRIILPKPDGVRLALGIVP